MLRPPPSHGLFLDNRNRHRAEGGIQMKPQQQLVELGSLRGQVAILHPGGRDLREQYRSSRRIEPVTALNLCLFERQPLVCRPLAVKGVGRGVIPAIWADRKST